LGGLGAAGITAVAGCSGESGEIIRWHAGGTGGTYFPLSGEFETIIEDQTDYDLQVSSTGASVENVGSLGAGDADFALIQNDVAYFAKNGTGIEAFQDDPVDALRGVATLYPETIHIVTRPDADISAITDLEGSPVNTGDLGSGTQINALQILESVAGLTPDDFDEQNTEFTQAANQIRDGSIDAAFIVGGWPVGAVEELATTTDINVLNLDQNAREATKQDASWFANDTIPGGTYDGVDEDVNTVSVQAMIATRAGYDADIVEEITEAVFENTDDLSIKSDFIGAETAQEGMSIESHEGATRYFE
jgi:TRAP transporter TAXI family solute receptor